RKIKKQTAMACPAQLRFQALAVCSSCCMPIISADAAATIARANGRARRSVAASEQFVDWLPVAFGGERYVFKAAPERIVMKHGGVVNAHRRIDRCHDVFILHGASSR